MKFLKSIAANLPVVKQVLRDQERKQLDIAINWRNGDKVFAADTKALLEELQFAEFFMTGERSLLSLVESGEITLLDLATGSKTPNEPWIKFYGYYHRPASTRLELAQLSGQLPSDFAQQLRMIDCYELNSFPDRVYNRFLSITRIAEIFAEAKRRDTDLLLPGMAYDPHEVMMNDAGLYRCLFFANVAGRIVLVRVDREKLQEEMGKYHSTSLHFLVQSVPQMFIDSEN